MLKHPYVGTEHFILAILKTNCDENNILKENNITYNKYKSMLIKTIPFSRNPTNIYTPLFKRILILAFKRELQLNEILMHIIEEGDGIGISILNNLNVDINLLYKSISKKDIPHGISLTTLAKEGKINNIIGRENELNQVIETLCRKNKSNPLLIGEAGVGKTAIVEGLAYKIINKDVPSCLLNKEIISISMSSLVSGTKYRGEFEEKLEKIIKILEKNKNKILFIDEIHTLVGAGGAEGAIDASNILKPYLARNNIKCIGSTTINEYNNSIKKDKALDRRFNKIIVNEPSNQELEKILFGIKKDYETFHNVIIGENEIKFLLNMEINKERKEPDRSIELLDDICTKASIYLKNIEQKTINEKLNRITKIKDSYIQKNEFKKAYNIKLKEINLQNKINKYKPIITTNFINKYIDKKKKSIIGFQ